MGMTMATTMATTTTTTTTLVTAMVTATTIDNNQLVSGITMTMTTMTTTTTTKSTAAGRGRQQHRTAGARRRQRWLRLYGDNEMQHDNATIKQSGRDEMRQGGRDTSTRQDETRRRDNSTMTRRTTRDEM